MPFIRTKPSEYLVAADHGKLVNRGAAVRLFLRRGTPCVKVPGDQQEACFEMTQETRDGIPLRFKGIAVFRIVAPALTAQLFDFTSATGLQTMQSLISKACLGELRDRVSHMTMQECIEERKTTLTGAVRTALEGLVEGPGGGWGVELDVVQVAQVFIVDQDLRRQLEAETRNQIRSSSELAELQARESVEMANIASERRIKQEAMESDRLQIALDREKDSLQKQAEQAQIETDTPVQLLRIRNQLSILRAQKESLELEQQVRALQVDRDLIGERAAQELRRQILPLEQAPQIVESVSRLFKGAKLSVYGEDCRLMETVEPLLDIVSGALKGTRHAREGTGK